MAKQTGLRLASNGMRQDRNNTLRYLEYSISVALYAYRVGSMYVVCWLVNTILVGNVICMHS